MSAEWCKLRERLCNWWVDDKCMSKVCMFEDEYTLKQDMAIAGEENEENEEEKISYAGNLPPGPSAEDMGPMPPTLTKVRPSSTYFKAAQKMEKQIEEMKQKPFDLAVSQNISEKDKNLCDALKGMKYDDGKLDFTLLPWESVEEVVKVLMFGAEKYERDNWKDVGDGYYRYLKALARHFSDIMKGEDVDPESKLPHLAHIAVNALFAIHFTKH